MRTARRTGVADCGTDRRCTLVDRYGSRTVDAKLHSDRPIEFGPPHPVVMSPCASWRRAIARQGWRPGPARVSCGRHGAVTARVTQHPGSTCDAGSPAAVALGPSIPGRTVRPARSRGVPGDAIQGPRGPARPGTARPGRHPPPTPASAGTRPPGAAIERSIRPTRSSPSRSSRSSIVESKQTRLIGDFRCG